MVDLLFAIRHNAHSISEQQLKEKNMRTKFLSIKGAELELDKEGYRLSENLSMKEDIYKIYKKRGKRIILKPFNQNYSDYRYQLQKFFS